MSIIGTFPPFIPPWWLKGPHRMTLFPRWWPRNRDSLMPPAQRRIFQVTPDTGLLTQCHWQSRPSGKPTLLLIHGLEGCTESHYMIGLAQKAWMRGWNCVRINQRNCGGSEPLTPTLYHGGLSDDYRGVIQELTDADGCRNIWLIGYSMGGNLTLKLGGEIGANLPPLQGFVAVCPNIQPAECVRALQRPENRIYHEYFLNSLKTKLRRKAHLFPGKWDLSPLPHISTMWEFDDVYTGPDGGFPNAADYYRQSASCQQLAHIRKPTLIMTAQDDPFIPFNMFTASTLHDNPFIRFEAPLHGGHCGFFQRYQPEEDHFWAENRLLDWIQDQCGSTSLPDDPGPSLQARTHLR